MALIEIEASFILVLPESEDGRTFMLEGPSDAFVDPEAIIFMQSHDIDMELVMERPMPFLKDVVFDLVKSNSPDKSKRMIDVEVRTWLSNNRIKFTKWLINNVKHFEEVKENLLNSIMEQTFKMEQIQVVIMPANDFIENVASLPMMDNLIIQELKNSDNEESKIAKISDGKIDIKSDRMDSITEIEETFHPLSTEENDNEDGVHSSSATSRTSESVSTPPSTK